ncbi:unnamed protein product [Bathycoccus prasinos]
MSDENLPLISYRRLKSNDEEELARLKYALVDSEYGFFQLVVDDDSDDTSKFGKDIKRVYDSGRKFFKELSEDEKKQYVHTQYETFETGGYVPLFEEYAYKANEIACVESFDLVRDIEENEKDEEDENNETDDDFTKQPSGARGRIDWPVEVPEMKNAFNIFYRKCDEIARVLFLSFAKALSIKDERAFEKHFSRDSHCAMRFMRYPNNDNNNNNNNDKKKNKSKSSDDAKEVGVSEHTDFEMMTFLHQNERGLYVKKRRGKNRDEEGEWMSAPVLQEDEAKFLVIISDGLEAFTNGTYKATPHRVERPENRERFSIVRFNGVNAETQVNPLPDFVGAKRKRGEAMTTQLDLITTKVKEADRNLKDLVKRKETSQGGVNGKPRTSSQSDTPGFIGKVETWYDINALAETSIFAACEALEENITMPENAKARVTEKARFRFHGWLKESKVAIEHECVLILNNSREKEALLKDYTELSVSAKETIRVIPKWFKVEDIPYAEMPEDDMHWYPKVIEALIVDEEKKIHGGYFTFDEASGALKEFEIKTYPKV